MQYAFEMLSIRQVKESQAHKLCFFIDGLDEYSGDVRIGISFIKRLVRPCDIKIIVSSRPIPACVDSFHDEPKLCLQDLTKTDIASYVDAEVGSHPYMKTLALMDSSAPLITKQLMEKASGVFLWIVLACRSVLEGFASCDCLSDVRQRVDELPPELKDLFQHMLIKVDHRYHNECARLLRTCYMGPRDILYWPSFSRVARSGA